MAWETCVKTAVLPQIYRDTAPKNKNNKNNRVEPHALQSPVVPKALLEKGAKCLFFPVS